MRGRGFYCTAWNGVLYVVFDGAGSARWAELAPATKAMLFAKAAWSAWDAEKVRVARLSTETLPR